MDNQQPRREERKVQRLFPVWEVRCKFVAPEVGKPGRKAEGKDIVCALWKHREVHKRTAYMVARVCEQSRNSGGSTKNIFLMMNVFLIKRPLKA